MLAPYNHQLAQTALSDLRKSAGLESFDEQIRAFADDTFKRLCGDPVQFFLDKTPRNYLIIDHLARIYPNAKFIILKRNPVQVYASVLTSWRGNCFRRHYRDWMDLFEGPEMLASATTLLERRSLQVDYEELVTSPRETLIRIQEYLGLAVEDNLEARFDPTAPQLGSLGDRKGRYREISRDSLDDWKLVFSTHFRKWYLERYVRLLDERHVFARLGYDSSKLLQDIQRIEPRWNNDVNDAVDLLLSMLVRKWNLNISLKGATGREYSDRFYT